MLYARRLKAKGQEAVLLPGSPISETAKRGLKWSAVWIYEFEVARRHSSYWSTWNKKAAYALFTVTNFQKQDNNHKITKNFRRRQHKLAWNPQKEFINDLQFYD